MNVLSFILNRLKREPVAVWGVVVAALIGVLNAAGVAASILDPVVAVVTLLGIPVVRGAVTPVAALKALAAAQVAAPATLAASVVAPPVIVTPAADAGHSEVEMILLVLTTVGVFLLLFGVTLR